MPINCDPTKTFPNHDKIYCGDTGCSADKNDVDGNEGSNQICPCPNGFTQTAWDGDIVQYRTCTRTSKLQDTLICGKSVCNANKDIPDCAEVGDPIDCPTGYNSVKVEKSSHTFLGFDCMLRTCKRP